MKLARSIGVVVLLERVVCVNDYDGSIGEEAQNIQPLIEIPCINHVPLSGRLLEVSFFFVRYLRDDLLIRVCCTWSHVISVL